MTGLPRDSRLADLIRDNVVGWDVFCIHKKEQSHIETFPADKVRGLVVLIPTADRHRLFT